MTMSGRPRLSIGMPVYNGEPFIKEAIDSILLQDFDDFELVISDNASTDRTREIILDYSRRDPRIRYSFNEENLGAALNYNLVFELSSGLYFKWAPADDVCAPGYFAHCVEILDRNQDVILCYPRTIVIDKNGEEIERYSEELHLQCAKPHERYKQLHERFRHLLKCNAVLGLIRASSLRETRLIGKFTGSDMVLLGELAILGKFFEVPEYLFLRRDHPQSSIKAFKLHSRATWFDPKNTREYQYTYWKLLIEQINSVMRSRIGLWEKKSCFTQVCKWALWNKKGLKEEMIVLGLYASRRLPRFLLAILRLGSKLVKIRQQ